MNPILLVQLYNALASAADAVVAGWDTLTGEEDSRLGAWRNLAKALGGIDPKGMANVGDWAACSDADDVAWYAACARTQAFETAADCPARRRQRARAALARRLIQDRTAPPCGTASAGGMA